MCVAGKISYRSEDGNAIFIAIRFDLGVLFCFCACAGGLFESHSVFFIFNLVAEIGERGTRGCVIVFVASFVGGGRSMDLRQRDGLGEGFWFVQGSGTEPILGREGRGRGGCCHDEGGSRKRADVGVFQWRGRQRRREGQSVAQCIGRVAAEGRRLGPRTDTVRALRLCCIRVLSCCSV